MYLIPASVAAQCLSGRWYSTCECDKEGKRLGARFRHMQHAIRAEQSTEVLSWCIQASQDYDMAMQREMAAREARWGSGMG